MHVAERRRYFRITDQIEISYRVIGEDEVERYRAGDVLEASTYQLLSNMDRDILILVRELEMKSPEVARIINLMNQKLNCVVNHLAAEGHIARADHVTQEVSLSACGMAFSTDEKLVEGTCLRLEFVLPSTGLHTITLGHVVGCQRLADAEHYYCRVDFQDMAPASQELLIQELVKRQVVLAREQRLKDSSLGSDAL